MIACHSDSCSVREMRKMCKKKKLNKIKTVHALMTTYVKSMSDAMAATDPSKDKPQPTYVMSIKAN